MPKQTAEFRQWALVGAQAAIEKMQAEIQRIHTAFPELSGRDTVTRRRRGRPVKVDFGVEASDFQVGTAKRKRTMSAEARKRIGDAQRARWAKQREGGRKKR
jgi:hypothetical protein